MVISGNLLGVTTSQLAKKYDTRWHTINNYLKEIYKSIPDEDIQNTKIKISTMFEKIFREAQNLLAKAQTPKDKQMAIDLLMRCMDKFQDFLERFGIKPKATENINIQADITQKQFVINYNVPNGSNRIK